MKIIKVITIFSLLLFSFFSIADDMKEEDNSQNNRFIEIVLFPINIGPDIVSNTIIYMFNPIFSPIEGRGVSNLWPIISVTSPIIGPVMGTLDAWYGYPFWNPVALDEDREY